MWEGKGERNRRGSRGGQRSWTRSEPRKSDYYAQEIRIGVVVSRKGPDAGRRGEMITKSNCA